MSVNENVYSDMARKRTIRLVISFMSQARNLYYQKFQPRYLDKDFIEKLVFVENKFSELKLEILEADIEKVLEIESEHIRKMTEIGMRIDETYDSNPLEQEQAFN